MVNNFVFYSNWLDSIQELENKSQQNELLRVIVDYGVYGDFQKSEDAVVNALFTMIKPQIDSAKMKYQAKIEGGKNSGRKKVVDDEKIREMKMQGFKAKDIADALGISVTTVYHSAGWK